MVDREWRRARWAEAPDRYLEEWDSLSTKLASKYASPVEVRWAVENVNRRIASYHVELEELDRHVAAAQLAAVREFAAGTLAAGMAGRLLDRLSAAAAPAEPVAAEPESYADCGELVVAYETAQSELGRIRNTVGGKRRLFEQAQELELLAPAPSPGYDSQPEPTFFSVPEAARSIAQLRAEFGDDVLLRHRQPLAAAVRRGEPINRLRRMVVTLESQPANLVEELLHA